MDTSQSDIVTKSKETTSHPIRADESAQREEPCAKCSMAEV